MPHLLILKEEILHQHGPKLAVFMAALDKVITDAIEARALHQKYPQNYPSPRRPATADDAVPISNDELHTLTGMSDFQLLNCKKLAVHEGYIEIDVRGIPGKRHYKLLPTRHQNT